MPVTLRRPGSRHSDDGPHPPRRRWTELRVRAPWLEHPLARLGGAVLLSGVLLAGLLAVPALGVARVAASPLPDTAATTPDPDARVPLASTVTDADGRPIAYLYEQYRLPTAPGEASAAMRAAVVAVEDRRFFEHQGVDWRGIGRAVVENTLSSGSPIDGQGASTVTMQYVKNQRLYALAESDREREAAVADTLERKLADAVLALRLEDLLTKDQILDRYLDVAYFGRGAYGVSAAAQAWFGVRPAELTVPQAALLAGMLPGPALYDPVDNPEAATARRNVVLDAMVQAGSITAEQAAEARTAELGVREQPGVPAPGCTAAAPDTGFFCAHVLSHLGGLGLSADELRTGGYTVRTTLDREATAAAAAAAAARVPPDASPGILNAVAVVEPGRDARPVRVLAANRAYGNDAQAGQVARPVASAPVPHGAGSVYKIFTAAAALAAGRDLDSTVPAPDSYPSEVFTDGGEPYTVTNPGDFPDELTLQEALAHSPNTSFLALSDELGSVDPIVDMAERLGLRESLAGVGDEVRAEERGSFTLGPTPTSPLELANVAATLVSGGVWCAPTPVAEVTDRTGAPVALPAVPCEQAVPEGLADALAAGLSQAATDGTAAAAATAAGWDRPVAAKTGTTQISRSAAFVGATPQLAGAVLTWSDASPPRPVCVTDPPSLCDEGNLSGGTIPAGTWFSTMRALHEGLPVAPLPEQAPQ